MLLITGNAINNIRIRIIIHPVYHHESDILKILLYLSTGTPV